MASRHCCQSQVATNWMFVISLERTGAEFDKIFYSFLGGAGRTARDPAVTSRVSFMFGDSIDIEIKKFQ